MTDRMSLDLHFLLILLLRMAVAAAVSRHDCELMTSQRRPSSDMRLRFESARPCAPHASATRTRKRTLLRDAMMSNAFYHSPENTRQSESAKGYRSTLYEYS